MSNLLILAATAATAAVCGPGPEVDNWLLKEHREQVIAFGATSEGRLIKVYSNAETGAWTLTLDTMEGFRCIMEYGARWQTIEHATPEGES